MTASYNTVSGTYDYGSVVRALQVQIATTGGTVKEYPYNYQGITQAIQDLTFNNSAGPGSEIGPSPSMGDVIIDANGNPQFSYSEAPADGTLWFDTRQGRLFIAFESQWYQTNGGDGFPIITPNDTPPSASNLVLGQLWFETDNGVLYIWSGTYKEADNSIVTVPTTTTVPVWVQLVNTSDIQTTANLPLAGTNINAKLIEAVTNSNYLPTNFDPALMTNQDDANLYFIDGLLALDDQVGINRVSIGENSPASPVPGQLWFDSTEIEMSVWYIAPGKAYGQWVPTFSAQMQDEEISSLQAGLASEKSLRTSQDTLLSNDISNVSADVSKNLASVTASINSLQSQITANTTPPDLTNYVTTVAEQTHVTDLQNQISGNDADIASIYGLLANTYAKVSAVTALQTDVNTRATTTALTEVEAKIPSLTGYATEAYVTSAIAADPSITTAGGTLNRTLKIDKTDLAEAGLDFSTNDWDGRLAQKYQTYDGTNTAYYATFGTNNNLYEYAWDFDTCEDFCWRHGTNGKVASIDKNGVAASNFYIADFGNNDNYGRVLASTIDVGASLVAHRNALVALRTDAASATTIDELKTVISNALANL